MIIQAKHREREKKDFFCVWCKKCRQKLAKSVRYLMDSQNFKVR